MLQGRSEKGSATVAAPVGGGRDRWPFANLACFLRNSMSRVFHASTDHRSSSHVSLRPKNISGRHMKRLNISSRIWRSGGLR